jgi:hypothetical protein
MWREIFFFNSGIWGELENKGSCLGRGSERPSSVSSNTSGRSLVTHSSVGGGSCTPVPYQHANHHGCFCWLAGDPIVQPTLCYCCTCDTADLSVTNNSPTPTVPLHEQQSKTTGTGAQLLPNCTPVWIPVTLWPLLVLYGMLVRRRKIFSNTNKKKKN